jgi:hypothetical protein
VNTAKGLIGDDAFLKAVSTGSFWSVIQNENFSSVFDANVKNGKRKFSYSKDWSKLNKLCRQERDAAGKDV